MTAFAIRSSLLLMTVLSALAVSGQPRKTGNPAALSRPGANAPFFLSAESASDEKGGIRWDAFESGLREAMQAETARKMSTAAAKGATGSGGDLPCPVRIITFDHSGGAFRRFDEIVAGAAVAYRAHVISVTPGFEFTMPVSLVGIEIDKVPRPNKQFPSVGTFYVIYPQADFAIGGVRFCNAGPIGGFAPAIGDQLLLFGFDPPITGENYRFLVTRPQHLVFSRGKHLYSPLPEVTNAGEELARPDRKTRDRCYRGFETEPVMRRYFAVGVLALLAGVSGRDAIGSSDLSLPHGSDSTTHPALNATARSWAPIRRSSAAINARSSRTPGIHRRSRRTPTCRIDTHRGLTLSRPATEGGIRTARAMHIPFTTNDRS